MAAEDDPAAPRPVDEIVDVLIVGSGASGAAVAWGLVETCLKILCLEQGDWVKPGDFPANGRDWEARRYGDFDISPNRRARATDYPINDDASRISQRSPARPSRRAVVSPATPAPTTTTSVSAAPLTFPPAVTADLAAAAPPRRGDC